MTIETKNKDWGFWGAIAHHTDPKTAWAQAMAAITEATKIDAETARTFLDSREGRHFADDTSNALASGLAIEAAIKAAVDRWMGWKIGRRMARETGIPAGLPYLTGLVHNMSIEAEA